MSHIGGMETQPIKVKSLCAFTAQDVDELSEGSLPRDYFIKQEKIWISLVSEHKGLRACYESGYKEAVGIPDNYRDRGDFGRFRGRPSLMETSKGWSVESEKEMEGLLGPVYGNYREQLRLLACRELLVNEAEFMGSSLMKSHLGQRVLSSVMREDRAKASEFENHESMAESTKFRKGLAMMEIALKGLESYEGDAESDPDDGTLGIKVDLFCRASEGFGEYEIRDAALALEPFDARLSPIELVSEGKGRITKKTGLDSIPRSSPIFGDPDFEGLQDRDECQLAFFAFLLGYEYVGAAERERFRQWAKSNEALDGELRRRINVMVGKTAWRYGFIGGVLDRYESLGSGFVRSWQANCSGAFVYVLEDLAAKKERVSKEIYRGMGPLLVGARFLWNYFPEAAV